MANTILTDTGVEVYESDIHLSLDQYIAEGEIDDMRRETQNRWNAALLYIYKKVFKIDRYRLKYPDRDTYNDRLINDICDIYIDLCYENDKEISIMGFSKLTGINTDTVHEWGHGERRAGSDCYDIYKKLNKENEESLSGKLISGGTNPMKILPALNRRHGWNMPNVERSDKNEAKSIEQIAAEHAPELCQNTDQLELPDGDF